MQLKALEQLLSQRPSSNLFHYTSQSGLHGIVTSKEIWATHVDYLNDEFEFTLAKTLALHVLPSLSIKFKDEISKRLLREMRKSIEESGINVCIVSFTENGDQLSQWRGYCKNSGYSLGFKHGFLEHIAKRENWLLAPCVYDPIDQYNLMQAILSEVLEENKKVYLNPEYIEGGDMGYVLNRIACIFKEQAFEEEGEWRLISRPLSNKSKNFSYRVGNSSLIPYYKLPLEDDAQPFCMDEIIVSPSVHQDLAIQAANQFLHSNGLGKTKTSKSYIPYRDW